MKRFIIKLTIISSSILLISLLINIAIYTFIDTTLKSQAKVFVAKYKYFTSTNEEFDTLFLGSSQVHHQIIPAIYDTITGHKSFNFGLPSCYPPECTEVLEKLLELPKTQKIKRIFFELKQLRIREQQLNAAEVYYNVNTIYSLESLFFHWYKLEPSRFLKLLANLAEVSFKKYTKAIRLLFYSEEAPGYSWIAKNKGYFPLEIKYEAKEGEEEKFWEARTKELKEKYKEVLHYEYSKYHLENGNESVTLYQDYLEKVLNRAVKLGIEIVLVIGPRCPKSLPFKQHSKLIKKNKYIILDFSSIEEYPELYDFKLLYDRTHFNNRGAKLYTNIFASKVKGLNL